MKAYVITIKDLDQSVKSAQRCIQSAIPLKVEMFDAITPKDNPREILEQEGIPLDTFREKYSYLDNCISAFLSHYSLWKKCVEDNEEYIIFEHDAFVVNTIPEFINYNKVINLGAPSYGSWLTPRHLGVNPLTSKKYFPGAHAYRLKPKGAKELIARAKIDACTTDVFLRLDRFSWLEEYYPWPVIAKDEFTTLQNDNGIQAKHGYAIKKDKYKIVRDF